MSSTPPGSSGHETWDTKWADFALVAGTGEELKCHKTMLDKSSPFFKAMLSAGCAESQTNKMEAKDFRLDTISTFLEYLYADQEWVPEQDLYKKKFDKTKVSPELMRMCHMYEVKSLHEECSKYLMENICDANAVGTWIEAERCENQDLKDLAIKYIIKKKDVPGMEEAYKCPELMKSLTEFCSRRISDLEQPKENSASKCHCQTNKPEVHDEGDIGGVEIVIGGNDHQDGGVDIVIGGNDHQDDEDYEEEDDYEGDDYDEEGDDYEEGDDDYEGDYDGYGYDDYDDGYHIEINNYWG